MHTECTESTPFVATAIIAKRIYNANKGNGMPMKKWVWVSWAMMNEASFKSLDADVVLADIDVALDTIKRNDRGEPLPASSFPVEIYGNEDAVKFSKLPDFFYGNGFWVVSSVAANVLRQFDLGNGALYPVKLFQKNHKTPVEGEYFCINFGNVKQSFVPEESPKAQKKPHITTPYWGLPFVTKDNDIAVLPTAFDGPDLWVELRFWTAFFVSDDLAKALKAAKVTRSFGLRKCRIVQPNL